MSTVWHERLQNTVTQFNTEEYGNIHYCSCVFLPDWTEVCVLVRVPVSADSRAACWSFLSTAFCSVVTMAALSGPSASSWAIERACREKSEKHWGQRGRSTILILNTTMYKYYIYYNICVKIQKHYEQDVINLTKVLIMPNSSYHGDILYIDTLMLQCTVHVLSLMHKYSMSSMFVVFCQCGTGFIV